MTHSTDQTEASSSSSTLLFAHPDAQEILKTVFESLVAESDRGAVLIGLDLIDTELEKLFLSFFPSSLSRNDRDRLLNYPGTLSSVASKASVAHAVRLIDLDVLNAISALRQLRNSVAHSSSEFRIADHQEVLTKVLNLGPTVPSGVNRMACEILVMNAVRRMREVVVTIDDRTFSPIESDKSAIEWLSENKEVLDTLNGHRHRYELGIGVGLICSLLIHRRDKLARRFSGDKLVDSPQATDENNTTPTQ